MKKIIQKMKNIIKRFKLRRLEKRGEVVLNQQELWHLVNNLANDLMPGPNKEIPRDLFRILAFWWAVQAERGIEQNPYEVLRYVREKAWLGYSNMREVVKEVSRDFPESPSRQRILNYFEEIDHKKGGYLFLPVVSSIDRHQSSTGKSKYLVDDIMQKIGSFKAGLIVKKAFSLAPDKTRERDVYLLALATHSWGHKPKSMTDPEVREVAVVQLRRLYNDHETALSGVIKDAGKIELAKYLAAAGREISSDEGRPIILETLYIAQSWVTGPEHFAHAFEITEKWF